MKEIMIECILILMAFLGMLIGVSHIFHLNMFGILEIANSYSYILMALFISTVFLVQPLMKCREDKWNVLIRWFDCTLFLITIFICVFFAIKGYNFLMVGFAYDAPVHIVIMRTILWVLILEGTRRTGGFAFALITFMFSCFPFFTEYLPSLFKGMGFGFNYTIAYHILSEDSALGIPMQTVGDILLGYLIFGSILGVTGASEFFLQLAMSLVGKRRGGVAKVSVIASGIFGTISGSAVANVMTIGTMTIPMMKKIGYPADFAGGVEVCSSNGGQLMPPVMGASAFVMASLLGIPYLQVALAAAIPAVLYYAGLLIQVDCRAALLKLSGLPKAEIPSFIKVFKSGWYYCFAIVIIVVSLVFSMESQGPIYASIFLLIVSFFKKETRLTIQKIKEFLINFSKTMIQLVAILGAVGMIIGSLCLTGVVHAFPNEILKYAGENLILILLLTAITSYIMGMGISSAVAIYVICAIIVAPVLEKMGLNHLAIHMFILYCGLMSFITPPVGVAIYPAAALAGAPMMKTGWAACRLGAVLFIIPFFFIVEPALVMQGSILKIIYTSVIAFIGVWLTASAIEGYLVFVGPLKGEKNDNKFIRYSNFFIRIGVLVSGLLLIDPHLSTDIIGFFIAGCLLPLQYTLNRRRQKRVFRV